LSGRHLGKRIVVVAHGGVIGSAIAQLNGEDANDWRRFLVHNCSITHVEFDANGVHALHRWNDIAHLEPAPGSGGSR
jgi:broad specificity phosphatase PhoE